MQRCLRVAGAKSDIESVGRTGRHGTFLEMLGNFSFGDYYKREAIAWAWEFVTQVLRSRSAARLYVTVHTGDDEAERIWVDEVGLDAVARDALRRRELLDDGRDRSVRTVHRDLLRHGRRARERARRHGAESRAIATSRSGTSSFNSTIAARTASSTELPRKAIDTGAGLERMLAVCNGVASMYETDLFTDLVAAQPPIGRTSLSQQEQRARQNIIADHLRAATFLINDGIYPSNTDRGFVLRFLIRRAIRNGRLLGYPDGFLAELVPAVVRSLEPGYPELRESAAAHRRRRCDWRSRPSIGRSSAAWRCSIA